MAIYGSLYEKYKNTDIYSNFKNDENISDSLIEEDIVYSSEDDKSLYEEALELLIQENTNYNILLEKSFGQRLVDQLKKLSPSAIVATIVEKFIDLLRAIWNQFEALCIGILGKSGAIKRYKSSIMKLSKPLYYAAPHYDYTNIREDRSRTDFNTEMNSTYEDFIDALDCLRSLNTYGEMQSKIEEFNSRFDDGISYFDSLRGKILGRETCRQEDFAKELYKYFRDGQSSPMEEEYISADRIKVMLTNIETIKNTKAIAKDKADIEKQANKFKAKFKATKIEDYVSNTDKPSEVVELYKTCINNNINRVKEVCNTYLQYFAAKLDAAKEEYSNDLRILYAAAQEAVRKGL